jgi:hypothetical protein
MRFILTIVFLFFISCKEEKISSEDLKKLVTIEVLRPLPNQLYNIGEDIIVNASITSKFEIHGYTLKLTEKDSDINFVNSYKHMHGKEVILFEKIKTEDLEIGNYIIDLYIHLDHSGANINEKIEVSIQK